MMSVAEGKSILHEQINTAIDTALDTFVSSLKANKIECTAEGEWDLLKEVVEQSNNLMTGAISQITNEIKIKLQDKDFVDSILSKSMEGSAL